LTNPLIEVKDLYVNFRLYEGIMSVLQGMTFSVCRENVLSLVGETGCGKSVTLKAIVGTLPMPPAEIPSGAILFKEKDLLTLKGEKGRLFRASEISMIPQEVMTSLNQTVTVGQQLMDVIYFRGSRDFGITEFIRGIPRKERKEVEPQAEKLLEDVMIPDPERIMKSYPFELSGGMRQRVLIAMALSCNPSLLLADEPGTALDVTTYDVILRLIEQKIRERNLTVIYVTHNLAVAKRISDVICVLYAGNIVEQGSAKSLFDNPLHPYTEGLIRAVPKLTKDKIEGIGGNIPNYMNPPKGCRFHERCNYQRSICKREKPRMISVESDRKVACFNYSECQR
jgi:oligopeptide/dipeptide ABC transporter ATP-binding protein